MTTINNFIKTDKTEFKKIAKKLRDQIDREIDYQIFTKYAEKTPENDLRRSVKITFELSHVQESLAKSFGFRNYSAINSYFDKDKPHYEPFKKGRILEEWKAEEILALFAFLIPEDNHTFRNTAMGLLSAVIHLLVHMRNEREILLDGLIILEYLKLENISKVYKQRRDLPGAIRNQLSNYLGSIPPYNRSLTWSDPNNPNEEIRQANQDYHSRLESFFYAPCNFIRKLEGCDPMIISPHWYQANYTIYQDIHRKRVEKVIFNRLEETELSKLYNQFLYEDWKLLFEAGQSIQFSNGTNEYLTFEGISAIKPIFHSPYFDDSWLADKGFKLVLNSLVGSQQFQTYYLSDLLFYSFKIVNQQKRKLHQECLINLLNHYSSIVEYSIIFNELAK